MTVRTPMINTDTDSAETFRLAMSGLYVPASALNARTGVTSTPTLTGTGSLTANISAFTCVIDGTSNSLQGAYPVANDNVAGITITTGSSQARIDLICLQIQDNDYDSSGQHRGIPVVVAGTPSGSPVAPATPANAIALWTLPVPALASSITFSTATAVFPYAAAVGGVVYVRNAADKPAVAAGVQLRYRGDVTAGTGGATPLESSLDGITYTPVFDPNAGYSAWTTLTMASGWAGLVSVPQYRTTPAGHAEFRYGMNTNTSVASGSNAFTGGPLATAIRLLPWTAINGTINGYLQSSSGTPGVWVAVTSNGANIPSGTEIALDLMSFSL